MKKLLYFILIVLGLGMYSCADEPNLVIPDKDETPGGNTDNDNNGDGDGDVTDEGSDIEFTEEQLKLTNKRGIYLPEDQLSMIPDNVTLAENLGWIYNMCEYDNSHSYGVECVNYVKSDIDQAGIDNLSKLIADGDCKRIMAFDAPYDLTDDAAIQASVDAAITKWASLQALKVPMGSPCIDLTQNEHKWFEAFMAKIVELEYRVNYLCVKYHGDADIEGFKTAINSLKEKYNLPILVTGFAVVNSEETTESSVLKFMKAAIAFMDADLDIYGYVWTSFDADDATASVSTLFNSEGLNKLGEYYINNFENIEYGQNLIDNPGFEDGLKEDYWTWTNGCTTTNNSVEVISGSRTCRMQGTNNKIETKDYITVTTGKKYVFGYTGRAQNSIGGPGGAWSKAYVSVGLVDSNGTKILDTGTYQSSTNKQTEKEVILQVDKVKFRIFTGWGLACVAYVDDIYLKEVIE